MRRARVPAWSSWIDSIMGWLEVEHSALVIEILLLDGCKVHGPASLTGHQAFMRSGTRQVSHISRVYLSRYIIHSHAQLLVAS